MNEFREVVIICIKHEQILFSLLILNRSILLCYKVHHVVSRTKDGACEAQWRRKLENVDGGRGAKK